MLIYMTATYNGKKVLGHTTEDHMFGHKYEPVTV